MSVKKAVSTGAFLLFTWLVIMLFNIWVHELGHAIVFALSQGWRNSIVTFGNTFPTDSTFMLEVVAELQASGATPETFDATHQAQLLESLGRNLPSIRLGVIGGWAGQLIVTLLVYLLTRTQAFREEVSGYGRLFWHGYILINLAWMGGNWLLMGLWAPVSSDPIVLINVILQRNPIAIGMLWLLALGLIGLAYHLARQLGDRLFTVLGLPPPVSQQLAVLWVLSTAAAGVLLKIPGTFIPVLLIFLLVFAVPVLFFNRLNLTGNHPVKVPTLTWQTTFTILVVMLALLLTNSGLVLFGLDGDIQQLNVLATVYCEQTDCLPPEVKAWFLP